MKELKIPYIPNNIEFNVSSFFAKYQPYDPKNKCDPYQTPKRNLGSLFMSKKKSSMEDIELHHSEISSMNNNNNNDDIDNLKNLETSRVVSKENDAKSQNNHVENRNLRKKICHKMSQILQEKYNMEKIKSQETTLQIEEKIRNLNPDMKEEYKEKIRIILKLMKVKN